MSDEDRLSIEEALKNHGDEARVQRQAMKDAIKQWGGKSKIGPEGLDDLQRAVDRLPMFNDEPLPTNNDEESVELTKTQILFIYLPKIMLVILCYPRMVSFDLGLIIMLVI